MISRKIDLTENLDFGIGRFGEIVENSDIKSSSWYTLLTKEELEHIKFKERFFGEIMKSRRFVIFGKTDEEYLEEMKTHCIRCGSHIRLPWKNINYLCIKCTRKLSKRIPWKMPKQSDSKDILRTR